MAEKASIILAAEDRTKAAFAAVQSNLAGLGSGADALVARFTGVATAITAALSVVQFRNIINGLDALNDAADATGSTIENLSALEDTALRTGTSFDTVTGALVKFNQALNAADPDSKIDQALKAIGLSADELRRFDPSEALQKTATALAAFADDGNKARLVQDLFGRSIREVAPLLKDLAEQGRLVATVTTEQAAEAERFNKQLSALSANITAAGRSMTSDLLPALNRFAERLAGLKTGGGFFASIGQEINANLLSEQLNKAVADLEAVEGRIAFGEGGLDRRRKALRDYIADTQRQLLAATDALKGFAAAAAPLQGRRPANEGGGRILLPQVVTPGKPAAAVRRVPPAPREAPVAVPQDLQDALQRLQQTDTVKINRLQAELARLFDLGGTEPSAALQEALAGVSAELEKLAPVGPQQFLPASLTEAIEGANKLKALRAELEELKRIGGANPTGAVAQAIADISKRIDEADPKLVRLNQLLGDTDAAQLEKARADMQLLADALQAGDINAEQFADAANKRLGNELPRALEKAKGLSEELGLSFSSAFEDAIVSGGKLSDVLTGLERDLLRILTRKFITTPLADGLGSLIGSLLPGFAGAGGGGAPTGGSGLRFNALGNAYSGLPSLSAYSGQVVNRPTFFAFARGAGVMGEAGDEGILPLRRNNRGQLGVIATGAAQQPAAAVQWTVVINGAPTGQGDVRTEPDGAGGGRLLIDLKKAIKGEILQEMMDGGPAGRVVNTITGTTRPTLARR